MENENIKEWLDKEIHDMECQFLVHKEGLGVIDTGAGYEELAEASSKCLLWADDPVREGFYYGSLNGEYLKLREIRDKLCGIDLEEY